MAYSRGSGPDRQLRAAQLSQDEGQLQGVLPTLVGQDRMYGGPGKVATYDVQLPPRGYARSRDYTHTQGLLPRLVGQDIIYGARGQVSDYDWPANPRGPSRARDYTHISVNPNLTGATVAGPAGAQLDDLPPPGPPRLRDYTHVHFNANLQQPQPPGAASTDLPARAAPRTRDYTWLNATDFHLIGQDVVYGDVGQAPTYDWQAVPRGYARSRDYTFVHFNASIATPESIPPGETQSDLPFKMTAARLRDYTWVNATDFHLIGQDAIYGAPGQAATYDWQLAPRAAQRARDYSFLHFNLPIASIEPIPPGQAHTALPFRLSSPRLRDYTFLHQTDIDLIGQDALYGTQGQAPTYDWQSTPRAAARARDYTFLHFNQVIASTEPAPPGQTHTALPFRLSPPRLRDYTWLNQTQTQLIGQDVVYGAAGQAPDYDWQANPHSASRARDYTHVHYNPLTQPPDVAPAGSQHTALPYPPGALRLRDYTWVHETDTQLIGRDSVFGGQGQVVTYDWQRNPRGYARLNDYTVAYYNPLLQPADVKPDGQVSDALPPRGYSRARDYSWLQSLRVVVGQDTVYGGAGQPPVYDSQLPPRGPLRLVDYTWAFFNPNTYGPTQPPSQPGDSQLPPRAAKRLNDYTWVSWNPSLYPPPQPQPPGAQLTEGPPRGPLRAKDYTYYHVNTRYIGRDQVYGTDGEVPTYDWQLAPRPYPRARDYTATHNNVRYIGQDTMYGQIGQVPAYDWRVPKPYLRAPSLLVRDSWNPFPLFTGPAPQPGDVLGGSSLVGGVLAGTSTLGSVVAGSSAIGTLVAGTSQDEL